MARLSCLFAKRSIVAIDGTFIVVVVFVAVVAGVVVWQILLMALIWAIM